MNVAEQIQSFFDPGAVARLAQAVGLEAGQAGQALEAGLPQQLQALAAAAATPEGEAMIAEVTGSLPTFGSVAAALDEQDGASNLQQAGELLGPALLGDAAHTLPEHLARQLAADPAHLQTLFQMTLPLLLSRLGQAGLRGDTAGAVPADLGLDEVIVSPRVHPEPDRNTGTQTQEVDAAPPAALVASAAHIDLETLPEVEPPRYGGAVGGAVGSAPEPLNLAGTPAAKTPEFMGPPETPAPVADPPVPQGLAAETPGADETVLTVPDSAIPDSALPLSEVTILSVGTPPDIAPAAPVAAATVPAEATQGVPPELPSAAALDTPAGVLDYLQARFSGSVGHQIGAAAGFGGGARRQAAAAALPVVLSALVGRAQAGGKGPEVGPLRKMARPFENLTDTDGHVRAGLLDNPDEVARIEGQGRSLLEPLFGDLNGVTGRLGSALGGSGDSSRRLLALMTPLVLSALTRAHPEHSGALGGLLGQLGAALPALLPAGLSGLGVVVRSLTERTPLPGAASARPAAAPTPTQPLPSAPRPVSSKPARPGRASAPVSSSPVASVPPPTSGLPSQRSWLRWLIPVVVLVLLGVYLLLQNRAAPINAVPTSAVPTSAAPTSVAPTTGTTPAPLPVMAGGRDGAQTAAWKFLA